jgi:hypothetical protein
MQGGKRIRVRVFCLLIGVLLVLGTACSKKTSPKPASGETPQAQTIIQPATAKEALAGGTFNKFFPQASEGFKITYTQEKVGFAEAKLEDANGKELATLSVFDTVSNPSAAEKYQQATEKLQGYPMVAVGENGTAILIAKRLQVQVRSKETSFDVNARQTWLQKFDLAGLAGVVPQ